MGVPEVAGLLTLLIAAVARRIAVSAADAVAHEREGTGVVTDFVNAEAVRQAIEPMAKAAASAAVREFVAGHPHFGQPETQKAEMPTLMKWLGGIAATIVAAAIIWMAATLNTLQITVARMDERQTTDTKGQRLDAVEARVTTLESYHRTNPKG